MTAGSFALHWLLLVLAAQEGSNRLVGGTPTTAVKSSASLSSLLAEEVRKAEDYVVDAEKQIDGPQQGGGTTSTRRSYL